MSVRRWFWGGERRRSPRSPVDGVVAFYFTGGLSRAHAVREVSMHGVVIDTSEDWYPGTLIQLVVQRPSKNGHPESFVGLWGRVVRRKSAGVCLEFIFNTLKERTLLKRFLQNAREAKS
jgi:hypothetical protein